jgi:hypothetical protein
MASMAVRQVLHEQLLYPYHLQWVKALCLLDFRPCQEFCQWSLQQCGKDPFFGNCVLFTDEAHFTRNGTLNFHYRHIWNDVKQHSKIHSKSAAVLIKHLGWYCWGQFNRSILYSSFPSIRYFCNHSSHLTVARTPSNDSSLLLKPFWTHLYTMRFSCLGPYQSH